VRWHTLPWIGFALLGISVAAQQVQPDADRSNPGPVTRITINGKQITRQDVLVRKGTIYVSVPALAKVLGASISSRGRAEVLGIPAPPEVECVDVPSAWKLSDAYRKAAVRIPDAIEALRTTMNKHLAVIPVASFDEVDRQIAEAEFHAQTDADKSVSYALSKANNRLAIAYFKLWQRVPPEYVKGEEMESVLCSMESKFALQIGRLTGRENCSVFHFHPEKAEAKPVN